jgi:regulator of replication initiation timing
MLPFERSSVIWGEISGESLESERLDTMAIGGATAEPAEPVFIRFSRQNDLEKTEKRNEELRQINASLRGENAELQAEVQALRERVVFLEAEYAKHAAKAQQHRERSNEAMKKWAKAHPEEHNAKNRVYAKTERGRAAAAARMRRYRQGKREAAKSTGT